MFHRALPAFYRVLPAFYLVLPAFYQFPFGENPAKTTNLERGRTVLEAPERDRCAKGRPVASRKFKHRQSHLEALATERAKTAPRPVTQNPKTPKPQNPM